MLGDKENTELVCIHVYMDNYLYICMNIDVWIYMYPIYSVSDGTEGYHVEWQRKHRAGMFVYMDNYLYICMNIDVWIYI
jgi:hypothetical protein